MELPNLAKLMCQNSSEVQITLRAVYRPRKRHNHSLAGLKIKRIIYDLTLNKPLILSNSENLRNFDFKKGV